MAYLLPTVSNFKSHFYRDFPYATVQTDTTKVLDADISKAITEASYNVNENLFDTEASYQFAFLYLAAHYLVTDIKNSSQGLGGSFAWIETSKSVGNVSQGSQVPQAIIDHPMLALLATTQYGAKYLSLILNHLCGNFNAIAGATLA